MKQTKPYATSNVADAPSSAISGFASANSSACCEIETKAHELHIAEGMAQ